MIAELGHYSLALALFLTLLMAIYPLWGAQSGNDTMIASAKPLAVGAFLFTALSYACLTYAFLTHDFTLAYVAQNSNTQLPWYYRVTAVWGGHEGSFLLWVLIFSIWTVAVALFSRVMPAAMVARVIGVLGLVGVGFYLYMLTVSNPFERLLPFFPVDGRDLNPLLQDFGMIIHPPLLYMGYVGFSVAFAFAISALISGQLDSAWARWSRPWTLAAWVFLTLGIALGSWWAYNELGWGGWWFWDPVENASFMPWLVGTALLHSLAVTEKRKSFKSWTVLLAIAAFSLSLLGTFLVRSGVLVSVHSFASDPSRGLFILGLLVLVIGGSLLLYALRAPALQSVGRYELISRETMLIGNNILLSAATLVVLLGTLLPLVHKELGLGSISVGAPFFNQMFTYLIVPFVFLLSIGPLSRWKRQPLGALKNQLLLAAGISLVAALLIGFGNEPVSYLAILGLALSFWVMLATIQEIYQRIGHQASPMAGLTKLTRSHWGMVLGHLGFAVMLIGITGVSNYSEERDVRMSAGQSLMVQDYQFRFNGVESLKGPNYSGNVAKLDIFRDDQQIGHLEAEKRFYPVQRNTMTEAAVDVGLTRDLYVALGESFDDGSWALRIYVKAYVRWIWGGAILMALGGLLSMSDKRYRVKVKGKRSTEATT
ncbi:Cytochrome c-type bioproteinis protein CcmF [Saliniradius amylolyticus]|uniref:Cytochrome c-type bioproteinis protein CcmF n=1 Tax=Saliniradius amylolyticus TaxID=2183582 RepID=A0A2S2E229_9ALTE|nr:heme lyase CcmF/NrfE family subunit [Saliniradius amylolyticus]AWL11310.1 Cytochrome c-type bioproteinis protein CcmF [Saliniradius amylolyticus]